MKLALPLLLAVPALAAAQKTAPQPTPPAPKQTPPAPTAPALPPYDSLLGNLTARNVGPTTVAGRVTDIAVYEKEPRIFYVAAAAGGVWKTENSGITFTPVFQKEATSNIGAIAVCQSDPKIVWVGTGEATSRNSAGWGNGIYKSTDGGSTWTNMGLQNCTHFSKILIDPENPNVVYGGGLGNLWGYNADRGLYKTTDGGKTWTKSLYVDDKTGVADVEMDPKNHNVLLCAMWEKLRMPYNFISGGPGSGLYRSTDAGRSWHKVFKGLPKGTLGRIGLNYFRKDPRIVVASVEAPELQRGIFRSEDGGESWKKISGLDPRPFYFSIPRQDPNDINRIYVPYVEIQYSDDMGKTFKPFPTSVHVDHHAFWIDPNDSNHILIGEDGGVGQTRDRGAKWQHFHNLPIGQFYIVTYDMRRPYFVYGGLQDNGCWGGPTQTTHGGVTYQDFYNLGGGDGFHVEVDPNDWTTVYSESQGGAIMRYDQKYGGIRFIQPRPAKGEKYRMNWNTPFVLSHWNSRTIYFGANKLLKSVDRGDHWAAISPDLTYNNPAWEKPGQGSVSPEDTGAETYDTIITIGESPIKQGTIWVGTDDGRIQLTQDEGVHWTDVTPPTSQVPANTWVSRVTPSRYVEGRAYATFDAHRSNDYNTYVFVTEDFGKTWTKLNGNLPDNDPCYVIKEGLKNPDLLFLGTEHALFVSFDRGQSWSRYQTGDWPTVPVYDLTIQPQDEDLVIGTHGRSIWTMHIEPLEELTKDNLQQDVVLTRPNDVYLFGRVDTYDWNGDDVWMSANTQPGTMFAYYLRKDMSGDAKITVSDASGENRVVSLTGPTKAGLNTVNWKVARLLRPGDYRVDLNVGGKDYYQDLHVEEVTDEQNLSAPRMEPGVTNAQDEPKVKDADETVKH